MLNRRINMRVAVATVLVLLTAAATLPVSKPEPITPVYVAFELYKGCMDGFYESALVVATRKDIRDHVILTDQNCLMWMMVWYKAIYEVGPNIPDWPKDQVKQLDARRIKYLTEYEELIRSVLLK